MNPEPLFRVGPHVLFERCGDTTRQFERIVRLPVLQTPKGHRGVPVRLPAGEPHDDGGAGHAGKSRRAERYTGRLPEERNEHSIRKARTVHQAAQHATAQQPTRRGDPGSAAGQRADSTVGTEPRKALLETRRTHRFGDDRDLRANPSSGEGNQFPVPCVSRNSQDTATLVNRLAQRVEAFDPDMAQAVLRRPVSIETTRSINIHKMKVVRFSLCKAQLGIYMSLV